MDGGIEIIFNGERQADNDKLASNCAEALVRQSGHVVVRSVTTTVTARPGDNGRPLMQVSVEVVTKASGVVVCQDDCPGARPDDTHAVIRRVFQQAVSTLANGAGHRPDSK
jgi:hypothetical protein